MTTVVKTYATTTYEELAREKGFGWISGIDEVGRGALAGPVTVGLVILPEDFTEPLADSKLLSPTQRIQKAVVIRAGALAIEIMHIEPEFIDKYGMTASLREAVTRIMEMIDPLPDYILLDGRHDFTDASIPVETIVRGDQLSASIAAASIMAKVARDELMHGQALIYPEYGFETHVGYGVPRHLAALKRHGPTSLHRRTYIRKYLPAGGVVT